MKRLALIGFVTLGLVGCLTPLPEITDPRISIASPTDTFLNSSSVTVEVDIENFELRGETLGGEPEEGVGHWHLYLSNSVVGDRALWGMAAEEFMLASRLEVGTNTVCAELTENNHEPIDPLAEECMDLDLPPEARRISIDAPRHPDSIWMPIEMQREELVDIAISVDNFTMDISKAGSPADPGQNEGHWHLYIGPSSYVNPTSSEHLLADDREEVELQEVLAAYHQTLLDGGGVTAVLDGDGKLLPGTYTVSAELVNHDHSPLSPPVIDFFRIAVVE
jgi:hypothetical protein